MIETNIENNIATVTLTTRTMTPAFFDAIGAEFRKLSVTPGLRAVVLQSEQKAFSYGLDLPAAFAEHGAILMGSAVAGPRFELRALVKQWQAGFNAIAECPVPVIAAVHSWCIGGGLDLISACDIRLVSADAKISLREVKVAIVADLGSLQRLPFIIGLAMTKELAYTGRDVDAEEAVAMGLANAVFEDRDALHAGAAAMAAQIAANAPLVVRGIKHTLDRVVAAEVADGLDHAATWNSAFLASADLGEAVSAFTSGREPEFKGE